MEREMLEVHINGLIKILQTNPEKLDIQIDLFHTLPKFDSNYESIQAELSKNSLTELSFNGYINDPSIARKSHIFVECILEAVKHHPNLTRLSFEEFDFSEQETKSIEEFLTHCTSIKSFSLIYCTLSDMVIPFICNGLKKNISLDYVEISNTSLTPEGIHQLAEAISHCKTIQILRVSCKDWSDDGLLSLCQGLACNQSLTHLDLTENSITADSIKELSNFLISHHNVEKLDLSFNKFGTLGITIFSQYLNQMNLKRLFLVNCEIDHQGIIPFSNALAENQTLRDLDLQDFQFGDEGVKTLFEAISKSNHLLRLNIKRPGFDFKITLPSKIISNFVGMNYNLNILHFPTFSYTRNWDMKPDLEVEMLRINTNLVEFCSITSQGVISAEIEGIKKRNKFLVKFKEDHSKMYPLMSSMRDGSRLGFDLSVHFVKID